MFAPPISFLPEDKRQELLDDLNYLTMAEIKSFCKRESIPYTIAIESKSESKSKPKAGRRKKTREDDRKGVVLNRVRHFLQTGMILPETRFPATVVCFDAFPKRLTANDRLFYGQYDRKNRAMMILLKDLTGGKFRDGAIARILIREFWTSGRAPTFQEYASAWLKALRNHTKPNAEWAFLSDRARNAAGPDWKKLRIAKASKVTKTLRQITSRGKR